MAMSAFGDAKGLQPPIWVKDVMGDDMKEVMTTRVVPSNGAKYQVRSMVGAGGKIGLISVLVPKMSEKTPQEKQQHAHNVYELLHLMLKEGGWECPVRFWNYFPKIVHPSGLEIDGVMQDNYMMYCAGRSYAMEEFFGSYAHLGRLVCTATGIGNDSCDDFSAHMLAYERGTQVENPRQVPAYKYSKKYGARPPSFSRATISPHPLDENKKLFIIAGTAAVIGEDTVHIGDWKEQTHETLRNMNVLLRAGCMQLADEVRLSGAKRLELEAHMDTWTPTGLYDLIRVYVRNMDHHDDIKAIVQAGAPPGGQVEYKQATVCRPDLLVEIEAVTELDLTTCFAQLADKTPATKKAKIAA